MENTKKRVGEVIKLNWNNSGVNLDPFLETKEIPTNIPNGQTPIRGVVFRKNKFIFDEVFFVNTEDLFKSGITIKTVDGTIRKSRRPYLPKESFYKIIDDRPLSKKHDPKKDEQFWSPCRWEYSIFNIEENKWERLRML